MGGSTELMQALNAEYAIAPNWSQRLAASHNAEAPRLIAYFPPFTISFIILR